LENNNYTKNKVRGSSPQHEREQLSETRERTSTNRSLAQKLADRKTEKLIQKSASPPVYDDETRWQDDGGESG
jgi:hypothetical protein